MIFLLLILSTIEGRDLSGFTSQPQDVSLSEGSDARFGCIYNGSSLIPSWRINDVIYVWSSLPEKHVYDGRTLIVQNVDITLNGSTYQCLIPGIAQSSVGLLIVLTHPSDSDAPIVSATMTVVSHVQLFSYFTASSTSTISLLNMAQTTGPGPAIKSSEGSTSGVFIAAGVGGAIIGFVLISTILTMILILTWKYHKRKAQSQRGNTNLELTRNDAYECLSRHRVRMNTNPSYELNHIR